MKKTIITSMILAALLASTEVYSNDTLVVDEIKTTKTNVSFGYINKGDILSIKDNKGEVFYKQPIDASGPWSNDFDFTNLPDSKYYVELDSKAMIIVTPMVIESNVAALLESERYAIAKPQFMVKDDLVYLSKLTMDKKSTKIDVYFEGYELAHSENLKNTNSLIRVYDFSESKNGNYLIEVNSEGRTFSENVNVGSIY